MWTLGKLFTATIVLEDIMRMAVASNSSVLRHTNSDYVPSVCGQTNEYEQGQDTQDMAVLKRLFEKCA